MLQDGPIRRNRLSNEGRQDPVQVEKKRLVRSDFGLEQ